MPSGSEDDVDLRPDSLHLYCDHVLFMRISTAGHRQGRSPESHRRHKALATGRFRRQRPSQWHSFACTLFVFACIVAIAPFCGSKGWPGRCVAVGSMRQRHTGSHMRPEGSSIAPGPMVKDRSVIPENDSKHKSKNKLVRNSSVDDAKTFTRILLSAHVPSCMLCTKR